MTKFEQYPDCIKRWLPQASGSRAGRRFVIFDQCEQPPRYHIEYEDGGQESVAKDAVHLGAAWE